MQKTNLCKNPLYSLENPYQISFVKLLTWQLYFFSMQDNIYLFGGVDDEGIFLSSVLCYDILKDSWTSIHTEMSAPRAELSAFTYQNHVYVLGGCNQVCYQRHRISVLSFLFWNSYHISQFSWFVILYLKAVINC